MRGVVSLVPLLGIRLVRGVVPLLGVRLVRGVVPLLGKVGIIDRPLDRLVVRALDVSTARLRDVVLHPASAHAANAAHKAIAKVFFILFGLLVHNTEQTIRLYGLVVCAGGYGFIYYAAHHEKTMST